MGLYGGVYDKPSMAGLVTEVAGWIALNARRALSEMNSVRGTYPQGHSLRIKDNQNKETPKQSVWSGEGQPGVLAQSLFYLIVDSIFHLRQRA